ncbi:MAG: cytochrome c3 family protein [Candidatus Eisenbacteria bacterium]|nr:cytochrome c3 family protein [Candidatus Eisenbacteria bacterium]
MKLRTFDRRALLGVVCTLVGLGIGGTLAGTSHRNEAVRSDSVGRFLQLAFVSDALAESTNPHGDLEIDCSVCHTATSWRVDTKIEGFDHAETAHYPLTLAHSTVPCRSCHTDLVFENAGTNCADCHDDVHNGDLGDRCSRCHTADTWNAMDAAISEHANTDFPLLGTHASTPCASCHPSALAGTFRDAPVDCSGCHMDEFLQTTDPNHSRAGFPEDCTSCHSSTAVAWEPAQFEHPSSFPLEGGHSGPACADCHQSSFDDTPTECAGCHLTDYDNADPSHDGFPQDCTTCHSSVSWTPADFDHDRSFPLVGAHQAVDCTDCHTSGYTGTPTECSDCHASDLEAADPNHDGFPEDCLTCHTMNAWDPADFDHDEVFPLEGAHRDVQCADCHTNGYEDTPSLCNDCHRADFENAEPDHVSGAFPEDCTTCHSLLAWEPAEFEHPESFPLTLGHADVACSSCHESGYEDTETECVGCHLADSQGATPSHDGFGSECTSCHSLAAWTPSNFEHPQSFKLDQGHSGVDCASCHAAGYEDTPTECAECHRADYEGAEPDHVQGGFPDDCTTCHSLAAWQPAAFEHTPSFPLTQGHSGLVCASCHSSGFEDVPTDCVECHLADSQQASPSHDGLEQDCTKCHSTAQWQPSNFEHPATFSLTQGHADVDCASCHSSGYSGTSTECVDCHLADSQQATPSHDGFSRECTTCHSTVAWQPAGFDHPTTFPLTQGHADVACASCHSGGYEGTSTECVDCHLADSQQAVPSHDGFSPDCTTCHSTAQWQPSNFEHPSTFPLTLGHETVDCASCHTSGYEGTPTDCEGCHLPDYEQAEPDHVDGGFPHDCTTCHSLAAWQPAAFEHTPTFPLTEGHADRTCASCHASGYEGTPTECVDCHLADSQAAVPSHDGLPQDCTTCHSTTTWNPSSFEHPTSFALTEGHDGVDCASCHASGYEGTSTDCVDCHLADSQAAVPNHDGLPQDCTTCHSTTTWNPSSFEHPMSFALTEGHEGVDCASCHTSGYEDTSTDCVDCHLADSQQAEPSHDGLPQDCTTCHSTTGWEPSEFEHPSEFPLTEGHDGVDCASCHASGYEGTSPECVDCHLVDSQQAEPSHDGLPQDCTQCHSTTTWDPSSFEHPSEFPLAGGHEGVDCATCHTSGYEGTSPECVDCHLADSQQAEPSHDEFPTDCAHCHTIQGWVPADFDHTPTFPLTLGHSGLSCGSCHSSGYEGTPTDCAECHIEDAQGATPSHSQFPLDCTECHSTARWNPSNFEHPGSFPLSGGHDNVECNSCHTGGFENTSTECVDCHLADSQQAEPSHDEFPTDCTTCHTIQGWVPADFEHTPSFPLTEGHEGLACASCHTAGYEGTSPECIDCHLVDFQGAEPDHVGGGFPEDCTSCHNMSTWEDAQFVHTVSFPLIGGHAGVSCLECHSAGYDNTPNQCVDCHLADSQQADPSHDGLPTNCQTCHSLNGWTPSTFRHTSEFPLTQGHADVDCASCHSSGYDNTPTECIDCHLTDFQGAEPDHVDGGFPEDCTTCHSMAEWIPAEFDHTPTFPLSGGHDNVPCASCHSAGYENTPNVCVDCHLADSQSAIPSHDGLPTDCTTCHTIQGWIPSSFEHTPSFPLTQGHADVDCASCHSAGYDGTPTDCIECHLTDYQGAEPDHVQGGFPEDCTTCHSMAEWIPAEFDHTPTFPLSGGHDNVPCASCHSAGYENTPNVCVDCHLADSQGAVPTHDGLPTDCTTCHTIQGWVPSSFQHTPSFPLTQGHSGVDCASCHSAGYDDTPTDCIDCHLADYQGAEPSHDGFPEDCLSCHNMASWDDADFFHTTEFPLTGGHDNVPCASCHSAGYENTPADCVECHLADFMNAEPDHVDGGFPEDCTACHTIQGWTPADFEHTPTFPLVQGHSNLACADCHSAGYENTSPECIECHLVDYQTASPDHDGAGFPTDCTSCHSLVGWDNADFDHDNSWFPIYTGTHREKWDTCTDCHTNPGDFTIFTCIDCHAHRQSEMDQKHQEENVDDYVYESTACYACHPRGRH